ncbi:SprT family zinc-dependent metalloprotease [Roseibacillus ishigakijimensis]|uniref:SprT-like domain-containing protein n=1 Tax=Roseibacillus ishigakijimensis TaxID=454146 RepID=A0A934RLP3_9BACT|nr:SprT family zinc-dependent metalloprotease [Roseibacillus ishigakijimensis]MBK1833684.1 SprT-like domain-containing protein [Roseibacillus ishigakijimensis]
MNPQEALTILEQKLSEHGLAQIGWTGALDQAERRFGVCRPAQKEISLSRTLCALNTDEEVLDTILHEIAHALAYHETGENCGHDERWKTICRRIGARPERCYDDDEVTSPQAPWVLIHRETGEIFSYHQQRPKKDLSQTFIRGRKKETLGQLEVRANPEFTSGPVAYLDRATVLALQEKMLAQLAPLAEEMGLHLSPGKSRFTATEGTIGIQLAVETHDGRDPEAKQFAELAPLFGLSEDDFRRPFHYEGQAFQLVAFKPRNRKYPVIGENEAGTRYKFPLEAII